MSTLLLPAGSALGSGAAILCGAAVGLRVVGRSNFVAGIAAGLVLGIAWLDLLPDALALDPVLSPLWVLSMMALGFALYLLIDRVSELGFAGQLRSHVAPASLAAHGVLSGILIGAGFKASPAIGLAVAFAMLIHGIVHGINTVAIARRAGATPGVVRLWVALNAITPITGLLLAQPFRFGAAPLAAALAITAGALTFVGGGELLPREERRWPIGAGGVALGLAILYGLVRFSHA